MSRADILDSRLEWSQVLKVAALGSPPQAGGGVAEGRGGVVKKFLDHTTPPAAEEFTM